MTTFTMQLSTRLRTWALVARLTGLLIALGALIGGSFLWLFVALAVAMNLAGYYYSDRLALRAAHAQPLSTAEAPELFAIARELSDRARIPLPRLYVMPGEQANAFATGRDPEHAAVAMTRGLLTDLAPNQVRGVLAHEFAHVTSRHPRLLNRGDGRRRDLGRGQHPATVIPVRRPGRGQPAEFTRLAGRDDPRPYRRR